MRTAFLLVCLFLLFDSTSLLLAQGKHIPIDDQPVSAFTGPDLLTTRKSGVPGVDVVHRQTSAKTQAIPTLGAGPNVFSTLRPEQNQISHLPGGEMVFIHRSDPLVWGGGTGDLRYDCSTDGGLTWNIGNGLLNANNPSAGRYPQVILTDENNQVAPVWVAPTVGAAPWDAIASGVDTAFCQQFSQGPDTLVPSNFAYLPSGMVEGLAGEFWYTTLKWDGAAVLDSVYIYKGTWGTNSKVDWTRHAVLAATFNSSTNGRVAIGPNMAFSPDGQTGYIALIGDIAGGIDSILTPIVYKSTDGGATWSPPNELDLSNDQVVRDSLQANFGQTANSGAIIPVSSGQYTCTSDYDITVDNVGNLHIFNVLATARRLDADSVVVPGAYQLFPGLDKVAVDIYTPDGGATWTTEHISSVFAWDGAFGSPNAFAMENHCQISRDATGERIFFSWVDQDSVGGLFGVADLLNPNLRIAGLRVTDGFKTCAKRITDGDPIWSDLALVPTLAPEIIRNGSQNFLPIVLVELTTGDPFASVRYHYFGQEAVLDDADFLDPANIGYAQPFPCIVVGRDVPEPGGDFLELEAIGPIPSAGEVVLRYGLQEFAEVRMDCYDLNGRLVASKELGALGSGSHEMKLDGQAWGAGMYVVRITARTAEGRQAQVSRRLLQE